MRNLRALRVRFWVETGLAVTTALLALLTVVAPTWIEAVFGLDPDRGNGEVEWALVAVLVLVATTLTVLARGSRAQLASAT